MNQEGTMLKQTQEEVFVKMVLDAWNNYYKRVDKLINNLSDEQLMAEVSMGRNRGIYLLGHLVAVTDGMLPLLEFGNKLHPELDEAFLASPDKAGHEMPSLDKLKQYWEEVNSELNTHIAKMPTHAWFERHTAVSEEDFQKEPHRNKLNILINRTSHQSYHLGQMAFLQK